MAATSLTSVAYNAADYRRIEIEHRVPGHGHDIRLLPAGCRDHNDRPWFEQAIDLRQRKRFLCHSDTPQTT
jgi:hypothetical protein